MNLTVYITVYYSDHCMYIILHCSNCGFLGYAQTPKSLLVAESSSAHVKVTVVCILCLMGAISSWPPAKVKYEQYEQFKQK